MRGVVFDLFHTLVDPEQFTPPGYDRPAAVGEALGVADHDTFWGFWEATYEERETTEVRITDIFRRFGDEHALTIPEERIALADGVISQFQERALLDPSPQVVSLVGSIAERAAVGLLSNAHEREVRAWPDSPLARSFTAAGFSYRLGAMKPDPLTYGWVLDRLGLMPEASAFVGNGGSDELAGAKMAGFGLVVHFNGYDRDGGIISQDEQDRRSAQADKRVEDHVALAAALETFLT